MRCISFCVTQQLLDPWIDSHGTPRVYTVHPQLLHRRIFDVRFRPQTGNRLFFKNRKFQKSKPEVENMLDEKRMQFCIVSSILLSGYFDHERRQRLFKILAPYGRVYRHTRTKVILATTRIEESKNEDMTFITKTYELSDEILFDFRIPKNSQFPVLTFRPEVEK